MNTLSRLRVFFIASAVLLAAISSQAASTSGGIILKEGVGARAQAMGEAFVGVANDASTLYWNPGGLSQVKGINFNATYVAGLADSAYQQVMFTHNMENLGAFGLGVNLLQGGKIDLDQPDGSFKSVQSQSDLVVDAGYGLKVSENLGLGLGIKMLNSTLVEQYNATAFAVDLGALLAVTSELKVGVALQNAGTEIKYKEEGDPLPLTARVGAGYTLGLASDQTATLALDLVKSNDQDAAVNMGAEYWYANLIAIRLGYKTGNDLEGLTAGAGFRYDMLEIDYAFGLTQELNSTHKLSLCLALGGEEKKAVALPESVTPAKIKKR